MPDDPDKELKDPVTLVSPEEQLAVDEVEEEHEDLEEQEAEDEISEEQAQDAVEEQQRRRSGLSGWLWKRGLESPSRR
jgi:hypothetical protein